MPRVLGPEVKKGHLSFQVWFRWVLDGLSEGQGFNEGVQDSIKRIRSEIVGLLGQVSGVPVWVVSLNFPTTKRTRTTQEQATTRLLKIRSL